MRRYSRQPHLWQITRKVEKLLKNGGARQADEDIAPVTPWRISLRVDRETLERLAGDYRAGDPVEMLQERYSLGRATVLRLLDEAGVQKRHKGLSAKQLQSVRELHAAGKSIREVAAALGVPKTTVQDALARVGQVIRPARRISRKHRES